MPLTQFETDNITSAVISLQRIADALETIKDRMPEAPEPSLHEADACDFPCDHRSAHDPESVPCYLLDKHNEPQPCIRKDGNCDKCPRDIALHKELNELIERNKEHIERSGIEGGKHA